MNKGSSVHESMNEKYRSGRGINSSNYFLLKMLLGSSITNVYCFFIQWALKWLFRFLNSGFIIYLTKSTVTKLPSAGFAQLLFSLQTKLLCLDDLKNNVCVRPFLCHYSVLAPLVINSHGTFKHIMQSEIFKGITSFDLCWVWNAVFLRCNFLPRSISDISLYFGLAGLTANVTGLLGRLSAYVNTQSSDFRALSTKSLKVWWDK